MLGNRREKRSLNGPLFAGLEPYNFRSTPAGPGFAISSSMESIVASLRAVKQLGIVVWLGWSLALPSSLGGGQEADQAATGDVKVGYVVDVSMPLESGATSQLLTQLVRLGESAPADQRVTVVMRYADDSERTGKETSFEDALKLARAMTQPKLSRVRIVALVEGEVRGHAVLPIIAADNLLVTHKAVIGDATAIEESVDETVLASYKSIGARRGLFPPAVVLAMVDPSVELARISKVGGEQLFAAGDQLTELRRAGEVLGEEIWSAKDVPLRLDAKQLRSSKIALQLVDSLEQAADTLDLAELNPIDRRFGSELAVGAYLDISGAIVANRVSRWQSNLSATLEAGEVDTWIVAIDSGGGDLDQSASLAGWFAEPEPPLRTVAGLVRGEARGDAALVAVACKPLFMKPNARLGGPGSQSIDAADVGRYDELIEQIARSTKRPAALIRGLLDPTLTVYRYTNRKTGRVRYATEDDLVAGTEDPEVERDRWKRGERIDLTEGLSTTQAISLGLAEDESQSVEDTSRRAGLSGTPPPVSDRSLIRFVEKIGRSNTLAMLLLFIGFSALSAEANAPGLSVPGFVAMVCFGLFFWMKFLAGTAEWLELVAFSLGLICIALEIFVVPGFGIFGIGGLALTTLGIVLMSQTFVIPRNAYQMEELTRGVWLSLGGIGGMIGGFVAIRMMLPHVPVLRGLVMEAPDEEQISESEKLGDFSHLLGRNGAATTPLMPAGKARFGEEVVQVVSDGTPIAAGDPVRVSEVHGTKVVVEAVES